ncbi:MAG: thioesterase, partial [Clostridia bacterium]
SHSERLGCGYSTLLSQGAAWILVRIQLEMTRYPCLGETVRIRTWPSARKRWFFPRYFVFETEQGEALGAASSLWALLDLKTRTMLPPTHAGVEMPDTSAIMSPLSLPTMPEDLPMEAVCSTYLPVYTDLDVNGHVNNTRYVDWLCNALGIDALRAQAPGKLQVTYHAEIRPGTQVNLSFKHKEGLFYLKATQGDTLRFEAGGMLMHSR